MKPILKMNEADLAVGFLECQRSVLGNLYPRRSTKVSQARRTFTRQAQEAAKLIQRIVISWLDGPAFQSKLRSAVPIYPRVPSSRIKRRMIRRHNIL
jgi:hypothetical protein